MKQMKKLLCVVLAVVLALVAFAACSKTADNNTENSADSAAEAKVKVIDINLTDEEYAFGVDKDQADLLASVNEYIDTMMADGTFDEICNHYFGDGEPVAVASAQENSSKDQLIVATNAAFEPFEYMDGESYLGIDMEIAAKLAESMGKELVIKNMDFDSVCLSVGQHKADIAMAGLTVKPEREEYVTFSKTYYSASQKIIVPADNTEFDACQTPADVEAILATKQKDTIIGVQNGTTGQFYVEGDEEWEFDGFDVTCTGYKNGSLAVQDLVNGNIQYVIIDSAPATCITDAINAVA